MTRQGRVRRMGGGARSQLPTVITYDRWYNTLQETKAWRSLEVVPPQIADALDLFASVLATGGRRFVLVVLLALAAAGLEGSALAALPVLLKAAGGGGAAAGLLHSVVGAMGLPLLLTGYVGLAAVTAGLHYLQTVAATQLVLDYGEALRLRLHKAILAAGWGSPVLARPADLVHALTAESGQCAYAVQLAVNASTRCIALPPLLLAALLLSPGFALAAVALAGLASLPMVPLYRRAYRMAGATARAARAVNAELADQMAGLRVLKILRAEGLRAAEVRRLVAGARAVQLAQTRATAAVMGGQRVAAAAVAAAGATYGVTVLHLETGALVALVLVFARLFTSIGGLQDLWRQLARLLPVHGQLATRLAACRGAAEPACAAAACAAAACAAAACAAAACAATAPRLEAAIRFEGVGFSHPDAAAPALHGIDLVLPARSTTVVAGPSGAGKSTLADLVMGLTAPTLGRICIDDRPLDGPARIAWRGRVAYVPQDPFLFHDTIRANLLLARPAAAEAELVAALDRAAARFVLGLPEGLDTLVGERGVRLSGGERQRIVLARALLMAPDLLVLDEATNALDAETERAVVETLRGLAGRMTILVIAHGGSAMTLAERVIRLDGGRLVAQTPRDAAAQARVEPDLDRPGQIHYP